LVIIYKSSKRFQGFSLHQRKLLDKYITNCSFLIGQLHDDRLSTGVVSMLLFGLLPLLVLVKPSIASDTNSTLSNKEQVNEPFLDEIKTLNNISKIPFPNTREIHDYDRFEEITNALGPSGIDLLPDLAQIVKEYDIFHDDTIYEFHNRIMNRTRQVIKEEVTFDPYDDAFMPHFLKLFQNKMTGLGSLGYRFWIDLERFLFKWMLFKRKVFADDDKLFEESIKGAKQVIAMVNIMASYSIDVIKLQSMTNFDFFPFENLVKYEMFDYPRLFELFVMNIIDNEGNLKMTLDEIEKIYCNGNFNKNPLLQMMITQFAFSNSSREQIKKKGWTTSRDVNSLDNRRFSTYLHCIYSKGEEREEYEYEISNIESLWPSKLSQSTIKFFLDNNLKFITSDFRSIVLFIERIGYMGELPKGVLIDDIGKFKNEVNGKIHKLDKNFLKRYLTTKKEGKYISPEDYDDYIKIIE